MAAPRVLVIGSSNTDFVLTCARLPKPGETLLGGDFEQHPGGKGANQAVAAARAGAKVTFLGAHGADDFGRAAKARLKKDGIDTRYFLERKDISSGIALILIGGRSRENMIAVARSANDTVTPEDILLADKSFAQAGAILAQLEIPLATVTAAAQLAARHGIPFILNPAPARKLPAALLKLVHTLVPNEHEAALLTGLDDPAAAAEFLRKRGCKNVVITLGAKGALLCDATGIRTARARKVKPVDTVGAGDCFAGWLTAGLAAGETLDEAAARAVRAAALAVTRPGAQSAMPWLRELASV